jgi:hypothetical protein
MKIRRVQYLVLTIFLATAAAFWMSPVQSSTQLKSSFQKLIDLRERLAPGATKKYSLKSIKSGQLCSLTISLSFPAKLGPKDTLSLALRDGQKINISKPLHAGDPDFYTLFRSAGTAGEVEIVSSASTTVEFTITLLGWPESKAGVASVEAEPNDRWREANDLRLGQTVWATADDKSYILPFSDRKPERGAIPYQQLPDLTVDRLPEGGIDWFKFTYDGDQPKLAQRTAR